MTVALSKYGICPFLAFSRMSLVCRVGSRGTCSSAECCLPCVPCVPCVEAMCLALAQTQRKRFRTPRAGPSDDRGCAVTGLP